MKDSNFKHSEVLLSSFRVILRSLEIRLDLLKNDSEDLYLKKVLIDKIGYYQDKIEKLETKLKEEKLSTPTDTNLKISSVKSIDKL